MEGHFTRVGPFLTHYLVAGEGSPVVLLHGGGSDSRQWLPNLAALASQHRVYAPDLPGFGSSRPPLKSYSLRSMASFVEGFLRSLGLERVGLVGHSLGGGTALSLALGYPQRVERLVLVDSLGLGREIAFWTRLLCLPAFPRALTRLARILPEAQRHLGRHIATLRGQRTVWRHRLRELRMPTLIVWGRHDIYLPVAHAYAACQLIPCCRLHILDRCGHSPCRDRPGEFNGILLDFFRG